MCVYIDIVVPEEKGGVQYQVNILPFLSLGVGGAAETNLTSSPVLLSHHCESSRGKIYEESLERAESYFL